MIAPTPGPWEAIEWACHAPTTIVATGGTVIAECSGLGRPHATVLADAAFIVRAVNSHEALLDALKRSLDWLASYPGEGAMGAYDQARAAIAKATSDTPPHPPDGDK